MVPVWISPMNRLIVPLLLSCMACRQSAENPEADPEKVRAELLPTEVETVESARRPFTYVITTAGQVQPAWDVAVLPFANGVVKTVNVKNGDSVKKGQVMAELENARQRIVVERAQLTVEERKVTYQDLLLGHRGKKDSVASAVVLQNIRLASGLAAAELAYQEALLEFENTLVRAPRDGVLTDWKVTPGSITGGGKALGHIFSPTGFLIQCHLLEQDALRLTENTVGEGSIAGFGGTLRVARPQVNPRVDTKSNLIEVLFHIQGQPALIPGLTAQLTLRIPGKVAIAVPKEAVVYRSGKAVVFTVEGNLAKWNYVTTGTENGKEIEITEGLAEKKKVIVTNNLQLAHDAPVKVM